MMAVRTACLLCLALILAVLPVFAEETDDSAARARVAAYAQQVHDYTWTLPEEIGPLLVYNKGYVPGTNGNRLVFAGRQPYVVIGKVRGVPYSLAAYGNGKETTFEQYCQLTPEQRGALSTIYDYRDNGKRISMRYGMSCATFLSECLKQGFPDEDLPIEHGVNTLIAEPAWKRHFVFGKHGRKDYPDLQTGDFIRCRTHAMLVMENDPENRRLLLMEQTPPDYAVENCENLTDVTVTLVHRDKPTTLEAKRLCMECDACLKATTGTYLHWEEYDVLGDAQYTAVFVKY